MRVIIWYWTDSNHILLRRPIWGRVTQIVFAGGKNMMRNHAGRRIQKKRGQNDLSFGAGAPDPDRRLLEHCREAANYESFLPRQKHDEKSRRSSDTKKRDQNDLSFVAGGRIQKREVRMTSFLELVRRTPTGDCWNIAAKQQITNRFCRRQKHDEKSRRSPDTKKERSE